MFALAFSDFADPRKIVGLDVQAEEEIAVRGYDVGKVGVGADLKSPKWFLPVNEIASSYCPTDRYSYLKKYRKIKWERTWDMLKGSIVDELYGSLFKEFQACTIKGKLKDLLLFPQMEKFKETKLHEVEETVSKCKPKLMKAPSDAQESAFLEHIKSLLCFEIRLCTSILDFRMSIKKDIHVKAEVALLFPFNLKVKILALDLGFSGGAEPDFIYNGRVIGDIKTGEWQEFFNLTLAAYALAYENENHRNLNLGIIINPTFDKNRSVPLFDNFGVSIVGDRHRKAVLTLRDKKLNLMKSKQDPGKPGSRDDCFNGCRYLEYCWGKPDET